MQPSAHLKGTRYDEEVSESENDYIHCNKQLHQCSGRGNDAGRISKADSNKRDS